MAAFGRKAEARVGFQPRFIGSRHRCKKHPAHARSGPREIARQLLLEFGEVARDHGHIEAPEDQFFRLPVEQESESRVETTLWRMLACGEPLARLLRHRHLMAALAFSLPDDHLECKRVALPSPLNFDHPPLPLPDLRRPLPSPSVPPARHPTLESPT